MYFTQPDGAAQCGAQDRAGDVARSVDPPYKRLKFHDKIAKHYFDRFLSDF